jgi:chaperonin GroES
MTHQLTEITPISESDLKKTAKLFQPLNDVVIVALDTAEAVTAGGILLPESTTKNANLQARSGTVVAHGPGARSPLTGERVPLSIEVGDRVIFGEYAGHDLQYGDLGLKAMREPDCMTTVSSDDALQPESVRIARKKSTKTKAKEASKA